MPRSRGANVARPGTWHVMIVCRGRPGRRALWRKAAAMLVSPASRRHGNVRYHVADDTIIVEFDLLGTNLGEFYGMPPTGNAFGVPTIALFFFDDDRIVNERVYFDTVSMLTQIGRGDLLALIAGGQR